MGDINCNSVYKQYGGRSPAMAGFLGALQGMAGMLGAGGFWKATSDTSLQKAASDLNNKKQELTNEMDKAQDKLIKAEKEYFDKQLELMNIITQSHEEIMEEQIGKNTLVIQIVVILLIIVIIYLLVL